jgi:hypothetical protein
MTVESADNQTFQITSVNDEHHFTFNAPISRQAIDDFTGIMALTHNAACSGNLHVSELTVYRPISPVLIISSAYAAATA